MPGVASDGGRAHQALLDSYHPAQAGQPSANQGAVSLWLACFTGCVKLRRLFFIKLAIKPRHQIRTKVKSKTPVLCFASWNIRTMQPGLMSDLSNLDDVRKTAAIDKELTRLKVGITALQETRLAKSGFVKEEHYTFYCKENQSRKQESMV